MLTTRRTAAVGAIAVCAAFATAAGTANAAGSTPDPSALVTQRSGSAPVGVTVADANPSALGGTGRQRVTVRLADGRRPVLALQPADPVGGFEHWVGSVEGDPTSTVTVTRGPAGVSAVVTGAQLDLSIRPAGDGAVSLTVGDGKTSDVDDGALSAADGPSAPTVGPTLAGSSAPLGAGAVADPTDLIDIAVGWTPTAETQAGGAAAIQSAIALGIAATNDAFTRSNVSARLRLVGTVRGVGTEDPDILNIIRQFATWGDGLWDNVSNFKERLRADIGVMLIGKRTSGYVGYGYYPDGGSYAGDAVLAWDQAQTTVFAHEVGHTLGASHDRATQAGVGGFYPDFGYGYVAPGNTWHTIMAYASACANCPVVSYFSNPDLSVGGVPLGKPVGTAAAADNRKAINQTVPTVSGYRYAAADPTIAFIRAAYQDFVVGQTTVTEVLRMAGYLNTGVWSKDYFLRSMATSDAWLQTIVTKMYRDTLGRAPDATGLATWVSWLRTGRFTVAQAAALFYSSDEFYQGIGGNSLTTWVTQLYHKLLNRAPDAAGLAFWVGYASNPAYGRPWVAAQFYQSLESRLTRVADLYRSLLGRAPDAAGQQFWAGRILTTGDIELAVSLAGSTEYQLRANARF